MEVRCLAPDCEYTSEGIDEATGLRADERAKRQVIDHMNLEHDQVHVISGCAHDFQDPEYLTEETTNPAGVVTLVKLQQNTCTRCGQLERSPDERPEPAPVNEPPDFVNEDGSEVNTDGG